MWSRLNEYSGFLQNTVPNACTYSHGQHGNILKKRPMLCIKEGLRKWKILKPSQVPSLTMVDTAGKPPLEVASESLHLQINSSMNY